LGILSPLLRFILGCLLLTAIVLGKNYKTTTTAGCETIYAISNWSLKRHGGVKNIDPSSWVFGKELLTQYLQKIDPKKVLLTEGEVNRFMALGQKHWKNQFARHQCDFFSDWNKEQLIETNRRYLSNLEKLAIDKIFPVVQKEESSSKKSEKSDELPKYKKYAKNEAELLTRITEIAQVLSKKVSTSLLAAYQGDKKSYIKDTLQRVLIGEEKLDSDTVLLKSFLGALDPYSTFFSSEEFEDFYQELTGSSIGIGVKVRTVPSGLYIEKILASSPAGNAKSLQRGDIITQINGVDLAGMLSKSSRKLLQGAEGSLIKLTVKRAEKAPFLVELKRGTFELEDSRVSFHAVNLKHGGEIGIIEIPNFYGRSGLDRGMEKSSSEDLRNILIKIKSEHKNIQALVLDMRQNPGGYLEEAVSMAGFFIGDKPVVAVVEKNRKRILKDTLPHALYQGPLVVLVDEESASASEVLTAALKDYQRALVLGSQRTYGKGSVQRLFPVEQQMGELTKDENKIKKGVVKLTTSLYYSPLGYTPANGGIRPHIEISKNLPDEEERRSLKAPSLNPFLQKEDLTALRKTEKEVNAKVLILNELKSNQSSDSKKEIDQALAKTFSTEIKKLSDDGELSDAIAITTEFARLEKK
jgi:carboxyl-terminal processing protease